MTDLTTVDTKALKEARTENAVLPLIRQRFSARAFSPDLLREEELLALFEAAAWAPSAMNEQPWRFRYALRGSEWFDKLWSCLNPGNQPWTRNAAALVVCSVMKKLERNNEPNHSRHHDLGLANAQLLMQATSMGIYGHLMGGFDHEKADQVLGIDAENEEVFCLLALGRLGDPDALVEPFKTRELMSRTRRPLASIAQRL
jgi:nitroreductase